MRTVPIKAVGGAAAVVLGLAASACGDDDATATGGSEAVVVTTNILGDVVRELVGDDVEVTVLMPPDASPHDFAPSARQAAEVREAGVLVVNGLGFEAGLEDAIDAAGADGVTVVEVAELAPDLLPLDDEAGGFHDHDHGGGDEEHEGDDHEGDDPHVFTDPARMAVATAALADALAAEVPALDTEAFRERAAAYVAELEALDAEVEQLLAPIPAERRVLVTNHDVFGYFADRYGFEVLGSIIPGGDTLAEPSGDELADLAAAVAEAGVPAIFAETSSPTRLAEALAAEGTDIEVVELHSESLGEDGSGAETYIELVRTNAQRIAAALG